MRVGPAVANAAYTAASSRSKAEKKRVKAAIRVAAPGEGNGGEGPAVVWREGLPLPPVSRAYFKVCERREKERESVGRVVGRWAVGPRARLR